MFRSFISLENTNTQNNIVLLYNLEYSCSRFLRLQDKKVENFVSHSLPCLSTYIPRSKQEKGVFPWIWLKIETIKIFAQKCIGSFKIGIIPNLKYRNNNLENCTWWNLRISKLFNSHKNLIYFRDISTSSVLLYK